MTDMTTEEWQKWMGVGEKSCLVSSFTGFNSPLDGKYIGSNKDLSAHNREHDVYQLGDDSTRQRQAEKVELNQRKLDGDL